MRAALHAIVVAAACTALGCANGDADVSELTVSFEDAMALCSAYCENPEAGPSCEAYGGPSRCYGICMATYETRSMLRCEPQRRCDRRGYCIEETMWAYFGCPVSESCNDTEGRCDDAMRALEECQTRWEEETPAWCEENCTTGCGNETDYPPSFGRWCFVPCTGDADCPSGSHCNLEVGQCTAECQWRRIPDDGSRVTVFCWVGATCDGRGCCVPRSVLSRSETGSYCDPP